MRSASRPPFNKAALPLLRHREAICTSAALEDHAHHADGTGDAVQGQPWRQLAAEGGLADGIGQVGQRMEAVQHGMKLFLAEAEALHQRCGQTIAFSGGKVDLIGGEDRRLLRFQPPCHGEQDGVALLNGAGGQLPRGSAGLTGQSVQILHQHPLQKYRNLPLIIRKKTGDCNAEEVVL